jgi:hypothetical protein
MRAREMMTIVRISIRHFRMFPSSRHGKPMDLLFPRHDQVERTMTRILFCDPQVKTGPINGGIASNENGTNANASVKIRYCHLDVSIAFYIK